MVPDGATGVLADKIAEYNKSHPDDPITRYSGANDLGEFLWGDWTVRKLPQGLKSLIEDGVPDGFY